MSRLTYHAMNKYRVTPVITGSYSYSSGSALVDANISYDNNYVYVAGTTLGYTTVYLYSTTTGAFSHTISTTYSIKNLIVASDGYLYGSSRYVNTMYLQLSQNGTASIIYDTGQSDANFKVGHSVESNSRLWYGSTWAPAINKITASGSSAASDGDITTSNHRINQTVKSGNYVYTIGYDVPTLSKTQIRKISATTSAIIGSYETTNRSATFDVYTTDVINATIDVNNIVYTINAGSTYSAIMEFNTSSGVFTKKVDFPIATSLADITYCANNSSYYFIENTGDTIIYKTTDLATYSLVMQDTKWNNIAAIKYIPSLNSVCVFYNANEGGIEWKVDFIGL